MCRGAAADEELERAQVWEDELWRLTLGLAAETPGFAYLEPKHISGSSPSLTVRRRRVSARPWRDAPRTLREVTGAEVVYVYIFGDGVPHLHLHLAPHRQAMRSTIR
jgi:hypothetical protein